MRKASLLSALSVVVSGMVYGSIAGVGPAAAATVDETDDKIEHSETDVTTSFTTEEQTLENQPWWGKSVTAEEFAEDVAGEIGYPNDVTIAAMRLYSRTYPLLIRYHLVHRPKVSYMYTCAGRGSSGICRSHGHTDNTRTPPHRRRQAGGRNRSGATEPTTFSKAERGIRESKVYRPYPPIPEIKTAEKVDKSLGKDAVRDRKRVSTS